MQAQQTDREERESETDREIRLQRRKCVSMCVCVCVCVLRYAHCNRREGERGREREREGKESAERWNARETSADSFALAALSLYSSESSAIDAENAAALTATSHALLQQSSERNRGRGMEREQPTERREKETDGRRIPGCKHCVAHFSLVLSLSSSAGRQQRGRSALPQQLAVVSGAWPTLTHGAPQANADRHVRLETDLSFADCCRGCSALCTALCVDGAYQGCEASERCATSCGGRCDEPRLRAAKVSFRSLLSLSCLSLSISLSLCASAED